MAWSRQCFSALKGCDEALAAYDKALALKPDLAEAWLGRGNVFSTLKRYDEALAAYNAALAFKADLEGAEGARLCSKMQICDWGDFKAECTHLMSSIQTGNANSNPFFILPISSSAQEQLQCAKLWVSTKFPPQQKPLGEEIATGTTEFVLPMSQLIFVNMPSRISLLVFLIVMTNHGSK